MILVCDAGSSKIDWAFINGKEVSPLRTPGTNPSLLPDAASIIKIWQSAGISFPEKLEEVHFFGAGCRNEASNLKIKEALLQTFKIEGSVEIDSDIVGAAKGLYGTHSGNIVVVGTGLNSGYYDGKKIAFKTPSLGYLLGDEGSGCDLGKTILTNYLRKNLNQELNSCLEQYFSKNKISDPIAYVYGHTAPNKAIAGLLIAFKEHLNNDQLKQMVRERFELMIKNNCQPYHNYSNEFRAVGSIAFHFQHELAEALAKYDYHLSQVLQSPIEGLISFYSK
jgi:N-acetylglucosamine kinase-like BadF-type ATPase